MVESHHDHKSPHDRMNCSNAVLIKELSVIIHSKQPGKRHCLPGSSWRGASPGCWSPPPPAPPAVPGDAVVEEGLLCWLGHVLGKKSKFWNLKKVLPKWSRWRETQIKNIHYAYQGGWGAGDLDLLEPSLAVWGLGGVHLVHSDKHQEEFHIAISKALKWPQNLLHVFPA